ncbi:hypothetical protein [Vibrio alfacsensis]|uniref:hypothetical protein n=1 Tax=Vibrio alfacsensis TaxID=1074311 RepID=UPI004068CD90
MSKLLKIKKELSIKGACEYLSQVLAEPVSTLQLYELAIERHLTISVQFHSVIEIEQGHLFKSNNEPYYSDESNSLSVGFDSNLYFEGEVAYATGTWDLSMFGSEFEDIDRLYRQEAGTTAWRSSMNRPVILKKGDIYCKLKGVKSQIDTESNVIVEQSLPPESQEKADCLSLNYYEHDLVIRTEELLRFVQSLNDEPKVEQHKEKPLSPKKLNSLLVLINALCENSNIDPTTRGVAVSLARMTEVSGTPLTEDFIRSHLKLIPEAVEKRRE